MKHILPILTLALLGAAATASAATPYTEESFLADTTYTEKYDELVDATHGSGNNGVYNYGSYVVTFQGYSQLKIHANENINLYVYDFVDDVGNGVNASALNGTAPGSGPVKRIGYREIDPVTGAPIASSENTHPLRNPTDSEIINREYEGDGGDYQVVRNSYYLGEFKAGRDYELFVSYAADGSDGKWSFTDGAGGYLIQKDKMMAAYLAKNLQTIDQKYYQLADTYTALAQVNNKSFGLRTGPAVGSPLPGGLPIALIAGLFGLGFWYIRRRKATVA